MKTKTYVWKNGLKQLLTNWLPYEGLYSSPLLSLILFFFVFFRKKGHHLINFYFLGFPVSSTDIVLSIYFVCVSFVIITRRF